MDESGIMLNERSILESLTGTVKSITDGNLDDAADTLEDLNFARLLRPLLDRSKGPRQFFDPSEQFGPRRVHETGDSLRACVAALSAGDQPGALNAA